MAKLRFEIDGQPSYVAVSTYIAATQKLFSILREIDQVISGQYHGSLKWYVAALHSDGNLAIDVVSRVKPVTIKKKRVVGTDFSPLVTRSLVAGFENVEVHGISPPHLTENGLSNLNQMLEVLSRNGASGYRATDLETQKTVEITGQAAENVRQLIPIKRRAIGSVEGKLEAISIHRKPKFIVYHALTDKAITCEFKGDEMLARVKDILGRRVNVSGTVHSNIKGEPVRVDIEEIRELGVGRLPSTSELTGSHPDITDGMTTEEYLRSIRGE